MSGPARAARWSGRVAAAAAALLLAACAQCGPPGGADDGGSPGGGGPGGPGGRGGPSQAAGAGPRANSAPAARALMIEESAAQLARVRTRLALTAAQAPAWDRYADRVNGLLGDLLRTPPAETATQPTAVQQIERRLDVARDRYTALESVADAARALYAVLDIEQRQTADRALPGTLPALYAGTGLNLGSEGSATSARDRPADGGRPDGGGRRRM